VLSISIWAVDFIFLSKVEVPENALDISKGLELDKKYKDPASTKDKAVVLLMKRISCNIKDRIYLFLTKLFF
jgi:hypothetical protein